MSKLAKKLLCVAIIAGFGFGGSGCELIDKLKGDKAETSDSKKDKKKKKKSSDDETEETEEEDDKTSTTSASSSASSADSSSATGVSEDDVVTYPDQVPQSGSYVLRKSFVVYRAADLNSKELGRLAQNTIINLKATYSNWMLVEWPSGIGELSPGWIQVRMHDPNLQETKDPPDAGTKPPDATIDAAPVDAGRPTLPDAGIKIDAGRGNDGGFKIPIKIPRG